MKKYFLHEGSNQTGPFDIEELKGKNLRADTPVWYEGLENWTVIGSVEDLKGLIIPTPPPFETKKATPPPIQKQTSSKESLTKQKKSNSLGRWLIIIVSVIVLSIAGVYIYMLTQKQQKEDRKDFYKNSITSYVTAEINDYTYNELGGIYDLEVSVSNSTDYLVDKVVVKVYYIKANGNVWDTRLIEFNLLNPHSQKTIKMPDTNRGTSVKYEITSIESAALGLN
jgi:hypothetical protein